MNVIKRAYYYLFYTFYKWYQRGPSVWMSDWKAVLSIEVLGIVIGASMVIYYMIFVDRYFRIGNEFSLIPGYLLVVAVPNYFIFHHHDKWKLIVQDFDKLPNRIHRIGRWIVWGIVILLITNLIYAYYLMSLIDWSKYR